MFRFASYTDLSQLADRADELFNHCAKKSVFLSKPWFENLIQTFVAEDKKTVFACVERGVQIVAILPLLQSEQGEWQLLRNLYSSLNSVLVLDAYKHQVLPYLAAGLSKLCIDALQLDSVAQSDSVIPLFEEAMHLHGYQAQRFHHFYNWVYRVHGINYQQYLEQRPAKVRNTLARKQRKLAREHCYCIKLFTDKNIKQGLRDYHTVYSQSWKAKELYLSFIDGLAYRLASKGWLRLSVLYIEKEPAAAQFWFVVEGKASIFKLVYSEAWKKYSPGTILTAYLMKHVIDVDKVTIIDFLTGNDAYKQDWMSERRERYRINFYRPLNKVKTKSERYVEKLKSLLKW